MKIEDVYPLSPLQEGMYYHWLTSPLDYFEQTSYKLKGELNIDAIEKSYQLLVARYAVLRTSFTQKLGKELLQVVRKEVENNFTYIDSSGEGEPFIERYKKADRDKGFDLEKGSQMRLSVLFLGNSTYEFIWSHHHILMDGWCVGILIREFFQLYRSLTQNETPELNTVYPYSSYIKWLMKVDKEHSLHYWKNYLLDYETACTLPVMVSSERKENKIDKKRFSLNASLSQSVRSICSELGITENTFLQTAWGILLSKYNNAKDVVFGSVVSGRPAELEGIEEMIGLFINTIPVRIQFSKDVTVKELLKEVHKSSIEGIPHHYTQLAQIQSESQLGNALFDHIFVFENYPVQEMVAENFKKDDRPGQLTLVSSSDFEQANYDLAIVVSSGDCFQFMFKYNSARYNEVLLERLQEHFTNIITRLSENLQTTISGINYLNKEEENRLLNEFNNTTAAYPAKNLVDLFEEQVQRKMDQPAVVFENVVLSYKELNIRSAQLSNYLKKKYKIKANDLVGVKLDRSEWMVIAILGIMKSGGAYVPIDPEYPQERIEFIVDDSNCKVVIDEEELETYRREQKLYSNEQITNTIDPKDLAYIIYTSGSTGQPKGVMIEHGAVANTIFAQRLIFDIQENERGLQFASFSFDASVSELFIAITTGAVLYIASESTRKSPLLMEDYIVENKIDFATLPPAYLRLMNMEKLKGLKKLITAGEAALPDHAAYFASHGTYYNAYGPTESSICASVFRISKGETTDLVNVPIGKPISNTQLYILDDEQKLLPIGALGEICIGGKGLARGYWNREELTNEKFVKHPFNAGERIYKTGDLGRWLPDGNIQFVGRRDDQVKLHGYRIELREIELALKEHSLVKEALVIAKANHQNQKELVAYIVSNEELNALDLQEHLSKTLPLNMIPGHYIQLEELPLTANGKIDRKKLPDTQGAEMDTGVEYVAPSNETEEKLVAMWQEILEREKIGVKDNFFKIGGHSLKAALLVSQIRKAFDVTLNLTDLFNNPTVEGVANEIEKANWVNKEQVEMAESDEVEKISI